MVYKFYIFTNHSCIESPCNQLSGDPLCVTHTNIVKKFKFPAERELEGSRSPTGATDEPDPHAGFSPEGFKTSEDSSFSLKQKEHGHDDMAHKNRTSQP